MKRARRPRSEKKTQRKMLPKESKPSGEPEFSQSPRLKNIPNIPGLMTGADMLRQQKKPLDEEPF